MKQLFQNIKNWWEEIPPETRNTAEKWAWTFAGAAVPVLFDAWDSGHFGWHDVLVAVASGRIALMAYVRERAREIWTDEERARARGVPPAGKQ